MELCASRYGGVRLNLSIEDTFRPEHGGERNERYGPKSGK